MTGPLAFRWADHDDVEAVVALVESAYRGDASRQGWTTEADLLDGQRTDEAAVSALLGDRASRLLLACVDGDVAGCCHLQDRGGALAYLGMFAVRPDRQGAGVGRAILQEAERWTAAIWGATRLSMTVIRQRDDLIAWYGRRGYRLTGETVAFPYGDERFGVPRRDDLEFVVLAKPLVR